MSIPLCDSYGRQVAHAPFKTVSGKLCVPLTAELGDSCVCFSGHRALEFLQLRDGDVDYKEVPLASPSRAVAFPPTAVPAGPQTALLSHFHFLGSHKYFGVRGTCPLQGPWALPAAG